MVDSLDKKFMIKTILIYTTTQLIRTYKKGKLDPIHGKKLFENETIERVIKHSFYRKVPLQKVKLSLMVFSLVFFKKSDNVRNGAFITKLNPSEMRLFFFFLVCFLDDHNLQSIMKSLSKSTNY